MPAHQMVVRVGSSAGGGPRERVSKKGKEERKSNNRQYGPIGMGVFSFSGYEKRCEMVCNFSPQKGKLGSGLLPIRSQYTFSARDEQYSKRS